MNDQVTWRPWRKGNYEVSSHGEVRRATPGRKTYVGRLLKLTKMKIGYLLVRPVVDGKNFQITVHSMVAEVFLGERPEGHEVNHIDGDKTNNRASNLEFVTHAGNMAHARRVGLMAVGERHWNAKLTDKQVSEMRMRLASGARGSAIAREYGVARSTVSQIATGTRRAS